jgi:hypothetical protein
MNVSGTHHQKTKMNNLTKSFTACLITFGIFSLSVTTAQASEPVASVSASAKSTANAPKLVSTHQPLSAQDLAKYQEQAPAAEDAANSRAAGASDKTVLWVVAGVVVVAGVIALASSGGGGGGGY